MSQLKPQPIVRLECLDLNWNFLEFEFDRTNCVLQKIPMPKLVYPQVLIYGKLVFVALSRRCPHAGCQTELPEVLGRHFCSCHGSEFDALGLRLAGPSRFPLAALRLEVRDDAIFALAWLT
jgi:cytochrome b6-f complex iron-sulfur subunit